MFFICLSSLLFSSLSLRLSDDGVLGKAASFFLGCSDFGE